jgi:hypothetical protein
MGRAVDSDRRQRGDHGETESAVVEGGPPMGPPSRARLAAPAARTPRPVFAGWPHRAKTVPIVLKSPRAHAHLPPRVFMINIIKPAPPKPKPCAPPRPRLHLRGCLYRLPYGCLTSATFGL